MTPADVGEPRPQARRVTRVADSTPNASGRVPRSGDAGIRYHFSAMQAQGPQTPYEVFCPRCGVTFPVGTRNCLHCGGRLSRERWQATGAPVTFEEGAAPLEEERPRMSPFSPVAVIWVLLFVAGTVYRACTSG